jgi:hypothetical protein
MQSEPTTTSCEFKFCSCRGLINTTLCDQFVSSLRQVGGFVTVLRFAPPIILPLPPYSFITFPRQTMIKSYLSSIVCLICITVLVIPQYNQSSVVTNQYLIEVKQVKIMRFSVIYYDCTTKLKSCLFWGGQSQNTPVYYKLSNGIMVMTSK